MVFNEQKLPKQNLISSKAAEISEKMTEYWYGKVWQERKPQNIQEFYNQKTCIT